MQRDTVDISGTGTLTVGQLPAGISNDSLTWVPVRLYSVAEGGLEPPTFAPNEVSFVMHSHLYLEIELSHNRCILCESDSPTERSRS